VNDFRPLQFRRTFVRVVSNFDRNKTTAVQNTGLALNRKCVKFEQSYCYASGRRPEAVVDGGDVAWAPGLRLVRLQTSAHKNRLHIPLLVGV